MQQIIDQNEMIRLFFIIIVSIVFSGDWLRPSVLRADNSGVVQTSQATLSNPPQQPELETSQAIEQDRSTRTPYAFWLLGSYMPFILAASSFTLVDTEDELNIAIGVVAASMLLPPCVHLVHGEAPLALRSFFLFPLSTVTSGAIGVGIGYLFGSLLPAADPDEGNGVYQKLFSIVFGIIGAACGAIEWMAFDIADAYRRDRRHRRKPDSRAERLPFFVTVVPKKGGAQGVVQLAF